MWLWVPSGRSVEVTGRSYASSCAGTNGMTRLEEWVALGSLLRSLGQVLLDPPGFLLLLGAHWIRRGSPCLRLSPTIAGLPIESCKAKRETSVDRYTTRSTSPGIPDQGIRGVNGTWANWGNGSLAVRYHLGARRMSLAAYCLGTNRDTGLRHGAAEKANAGPSCQCHQFLLGDCHRPN